jgi:hypothetical protein
VSNPVPPPGGAFPPPPAQGQPGPFPAASPAEPGVSSAEPGASSAEPGAFPAAPGASSAAPGAFPAAPGQPVPGAEPAQFSPFPTDPPKKSAKARVLSVLGIIVVVIIVGALKLGIGGLFNKDEAKEAKVGDCVAAQGKVPTEEGKSSEAEAKVVDCTSTDAAYTVVGRVNGETDTQSKSCDQYFTDEKADYFVYSSTSGDGYLLCLQSKA